MIVFKHSGSFKKTESFLSKAERAEYLRVLDKYGKAGVNALSAATPVDTGETANSWSYDIKLQKGYYTLTWTNSHVVNGIPIVILIQYGHGTGTGGYVQGRDFINPAIRPIFDKLAEEAWREVTNS